MLRFLLLMLLLLPLSGRVLAVEPLEADSKSGGCPSSTQVEAPVAVATPVATPGSPPALKSPENGSAESDQRPRPRPRGPAWHSFLPGMFK